MGFIASLFLGLGAVFIFIAGLGLVRMRTLFMRMQSTSKASTLGVILMSVGLMIHVSTPEVLVKCAIICILLVLTAPLAAHAIAISAEKQDYDC